MWLWLFWTRSGYRAVEAKDGTLVPAAQEHQQPGSEEYAVVTEL
jgi:hypothetical protein